MTAKKTSAILRSCGGCELPISHTNVSWLPYMTEEPPPNKLEHPCFPQPPDGSLGVWRYIDLSKFIWLLSNRKLYLPRLDQLSDPHEGSTPRLLAEMRDRYIAELTKGKNQTSMSEINEQSRRSLYVSCWQTAETESEAMWRLYCPSNEGIALKTTYSKLVDSVSHDPNLYVGLVRYIDYEKHGFPIDNLFYPVMHKRISFSHEAEVRLVKTLSEYWGPKSADSPLGIDIDWSFSDVVEAIYVNPYAPEYYRAVVSTVIQQFDPSLEKNVHWSTMRSAPVY